VCENIRVTVSFGPEKTKSKGNQLTVSTVTTLAS